MRGGQRESGGKTAGSLIVALFVALNLGAVGPSLAVTPSCGCGQEPPAAPGSDTYLSITAAQYPEARAGSYLLYVPAGYDPDVPLPLVIGFHGWTSSASGLKLGSRLETTADSHGLIPAFLEGVDYPAAGRGWAFPGCNASPEPGQVDSFGRRAVCSSGDVYDCDSTTCPSASCEDQCAASGPPCPSVQCECLMGSSTNCNWCGCVDDAAFTRAVVDDISRRMCVDLDRVYATGMSAGGMMASWLVGDMHDVFAAFAPVSGTNPRDFYKLPPAAADVGVMWIHGTQDTTVPHDGDPASDGYFYEAAADESLRVAQAFGCNSSTSTWSIPPSVQAPGNANLQCTQHAGCPEAQPGSGARSVAYCLWSGGHTWPKAAGASEGGLWGNRLMIEFFLAHQRTALEPFCPATSCVPPDQPLLIQGISPSTDGNAFPVLTFEDVNLPEQVTGYNIYRALDPGLDPGLWNLLDTDVPDQDLVAPQVQWTDTSGGDPVIGAAYYYEVTALNSHCPAESPR